MKKGLLVLLVILTAGIGVSLWKWDTWFSNPPEAAYVTPSTPDRIILTLGEDGQHSRAVSWRCDSLLQPASVQITQLTGSDTLQLPAQGEVVESRSGKSAFYRVQMTSLQAGKSYAYRVQTGAHHSAWYTFRMAKEEQPTSFIYLGDVQDELGGSTQEVFRDIHRHHPNVDFWALVGDVIERPMDAYWNYWHTSMDSIVGQMPLVAATGNHEYLKGAIKTLDPRWTHSFVNPTNGPEGFVGRSYFVDYGKLRYIVLDTDGIQSPLALYRHCAWLKQVLSTGTDQWKIVMMHHPVYSVREGRNNLWVRWSFKPIFEQYGADLVLQGHDHGYSRITTKAEGRKQSPVYVVSSSSPKSYRIGFDPIHDREGSNLPLYQLITLAGDTLHYQSFTQEGHRLYDDLTLTHLAGQPSQVTDHATTWPEHLALPAAYQSNEKKRQKYLQEVQAREESLRRR